MKRTCPGRWQTHPQMHWCTLDEVRVFFFAVVECTPVYALGPDTVRWAYRPSTVFGSVVVVGPSTTPGHGDVWCLQCSWCMAPPSASYGSHVRHLPVVQGIYWVWLSWRRIQWPLEWALRHRASSSTQGRWDCIGDAAELGVLYKGGLCRYRFHCRGVRWLSGWVWWWWGGSRGDTLDQNLCNRIFCVARNLHTITNQPLKQSVIPSSLPHSGNVSQHMNQTRTKWEQKNKHSDPEQIWNQTKTKQTVQSLSSNKIGRMHLRD